MMASMSSSCVHSFDLTQVGPEVVALIEHPRAIENIDEILAEVTDEQGRFIPPNQNAADVATQAFNRGQDPAAAIR